MSIRVLIVDDQPLLRAGSRMILGAEPDIDVVGEAADGAAGVSESRRTRPDVVLMDIRMPVLDGVAATRRLAGPGVEGPTKVLILTTFDLDEYEPTGNLDSGRSIEILRLLRTFNRERGQTFVLVTHDQEVGDACDRVVRVRDGVIAGESHDGARLVA